MNPENKEGIKYQDIACAIIEDNGKILVTRLSQGDAFAGKWEFPGGKREYGETPEEALVEEIKEELGSDDIEILKALPVVDYEYKTEKGVNNYRLYAFICKMRHANHLLLGREHGEFRWVSVEELKELDFLESDKALFPFLESYGKQGNRGAFS